MEEFESIYKKYYKYVKQYVISLCFDEMIAEDITQETFLKAFEKADKFKGDSRIETWLCAIAKNIFLSYKRRKKEESIDNYEYLTSEFTVENDSEDKETAKRILRILMSMKSPQKDVFYMRAMGEMPFDVISQIFGKTESWARVTYYRAKKEIIERLGENDE